MNLAVIRWQYPAYSQCAGIYRKDTAAGGARVPETLQQQLAEAKEEVQRPFPQEAELNEKSARLAELNALLDMDEKGDDAALGMDEEVTDSELPAPKREIERSADSVKRPSIPAQLHEKQAERMAEPKTQKKKSHDMEL